MENSKDEVGFTIKFREDPILLDPRSDKLGARLVINLEKLYLSIKKLGLKVSNINEYYNYRSGKIRSKHLFSVAAKRDPAFDAREKTSICQLN